MNYQYKAEQTVMEFPGHNNALNFPSTNDKKIQSLSIIGSPIS